MQNEEEAEEDEEEEKRSSFLALPHTIVDAMLEMPEGQRKGDKRK